MASGRPKGSKDTKPRSMAHKPWEQSPIIADQQKELPAEYNARRIGFMMDIMPTEPLDYSDVEEMERRFARYLQKCAEWGMKIGNQAAYLAIGINKDHVYDWVNRANVNKSRSEFIRKVQYICATYREGLMEDGKINPVTGIFWQKNYDGMRDQQEVVLTPNASPLGEQADAEALKQKYLENTYGVTEALPEGAEDLQKGAEGIVIEIPEKA